MDFLVHIVVTWPAGITDEEQKRLLAAEAVRAKELAAEGRLRRLWRIPGQKANWGIWNAPNPSELHAAISSLPMWPYLVAEVHPLAVHGNDPAGGAPV